MSGMTVNDLREAKGKRTIAHMQVARKKKAIAVAEAGLDVKGILQVVEKYHAATKANWTPRLIS